MHEFKVNGEMAEVTVAREGQEWLLENTEQRINKRTNNGSARQ